MYKSVTIIYHQYNVDKKSGRGGDKEPYYLYLSYWPVRQKIW